MDVVSLPGMLEREQEAFHAGITAGALMEAAGYAMTKRILAIYPHARNFLVLAGKGNNGGDGLVVARHLASAQREVQVVITAAEDELGELPRAQLEKLHTAFEQIGIAFADEEFRFPESDGVVIDALLGVQARGALRGGIAEMVAKLNTARTSRFFRTVALDLPTGLAAFEDGSVPQNQNDAVVADVTIAVGFAKEVLVREELSGWVGRLDVVPWSEEQSPSVPRQVLVAHELAGLIPRRNAHSHKDDFGRLAVVAGSLGFTGAPVLCAQAALGMGTGLLSVVTRPDASSIVAAHALPEAMVSAWPTGKISEAVSKASAIVIGPGLGTDAETVRLLRTVLAVGCPVLIDADGLNMLAKNLELIHGAKGPLVLTPHPGEMARLIGRKFEANERENLARRFVDHYNVTLVLKGTRTLVTAPGQPFFINTTGNPGLSTGGSGDTLSGIIGALLAQGLTPIDASRLGVWLHGHAADLVLAARGCEEGMTATMLSAFLGAALSSLRAQATAPLGLLERARFMHES